MRCRGDITFSRLQFGEIRNARQSTAASHSAKLSKHQTSITLDGDCVKTGSRSGVVVTSRFRGPKSAKYAMRGRTPPHDFQLTSARTKRTPPSTLMLSKQGITPVYTRKSVLAKCRSANDGTSPHASCPTNCHGFCIAAKAVLDRNSESTKRHETRGHSSWFDVVLSQIRLQSLRMSSVSACKQRRVLRWSGGRRRAAPSNVGHDCAPGALCIASQRD